MTQISNSVFYGVPTIDRRIDVECINAIHDAVRWYGGEIRCMMGMSDIAFARDILTTRFKESDKEWFMMIDSDIIFEKEDLLYLWEGDDLDIVTAPYARKKPGEEPCLMGLGFTRVHRRVFNLLDTLKDDNGDDMAREFFHQGQMHRHYFMNGVSGDSRYISEDRAFFTLCKMVDANFRMEYRCKLGHVGPFIYKFPFQDGGARFWNPKPGTDLGRYLEIPDESENLVCEPHGALNCPECSRPVVIM